MVWFALSLLAELLSTAKARNLAPSAPSYMSTVTFQTFPVPVYSMVWKVQDPTGIVQYVAPTQVMAWSGSGATSALKVILSGDWGNSGSHQLPVTVSAASAVCGPTVSVARTATRAKTMAPLIGRSEEHTSELH